MTTTDKIIGTPEGRVGIWIISADQAASILNENDDSEFVHNFLIGESPVMIGATWTKDEAVNLCRKPGVRCGMMFPPNDFVKHQLVVLDDQVGRRWSFDVGEISEERMQSEAAR